MTRNRRGLLFIDKPQVQALQQGYANSALAFLQLPRAPIVLIDRAVLR